MDPVVQGHYSAERRNSSSKDNNKDNSKNSSKDNKTTTAVKTAVKTGVNTSYMSIILRCAFFLLNLLLLCMCSHTTIHVSAYYYIFVLILEWISSYMSITLRCVFLYVFECVIKDTHARHICVSAYLRTHTTHALKEAVGAPLLVPLVLAQVVEPRRRFFLCFFPFFCRFFVCIEREKSAVRWRMSVRF